MPEQSESRDNRRRNFRTPAPFKVSIRLAEWEEAEEARLKGDGFLSSRIGDGGVGDLSGADNPALKQVMDLMLRRANENMLHEITPGDPDVHMPQIRANQVKGCTEHVRVDDVQEREIVAKQIQECAGNQAERENPVKMEGDTLYRVDSVQSNRIHDDCRMMHLVEWPQDRHYMKQPVSKEAEEVNDQEYGYRVQDQNRCAG